MLSGPELARLLKEFQEQYVEDDDSDSPRKCLHHEQGLATQRNFQTQVNRLSTTIEKIGNPFTDAFPELVNIHSRDCANDAVAASICCIEETGKRQYKKYVEDRLEKPVISVGQMIAKNALPLFRNSKAKVPSKQNQKVKSLRDNVALFGHLYVAMQNRNGDLKEFLYVPENKQELFSFLTNKVTEHEFPEERIVVITDAQSVGVVGTELIKFAFPICNHEEADTRIVVRVRHLLALAA